MIDILVGDCLETLRSLPDASVQCCITSPPYYGLRDYGAEGQIGREEDHHAYIDNLVAVFREVRRILRDDGTLWLNLGDSYARVGGTDRSVSASATVGATKLAQRAQGDRTRRKLPDGIKQKDRMLIPARVAIALQDDGWWVRDEVVWHKPRTTPFPANDRTVAAHEMVYLLTKQPRYFFDWAAIEEPAAYPGLKKHLRGAEAAAPGVGTKWKYEGREVVVRDTRRARSVWSISPSPSREGHFAMMPPPLVEKCVLAGSKPGDLVLDPFGGAGTTALVASQHGRRAILCEINPAYARLSKRRLGVPLTLSEGLAALGEAMDSWREALSE